MNYQDFDAVREAAKDAKRAVHGGDNFPGLGHYDRVYALPDDGYGWPCVAIVRTGALNQWQGERGMVPIEVHSFRRTGHAQELPFSEMTAHQLDAVADIKRRVANWLLGSIERLPPSTTRHWDRNGEL